MNCFSFASTDILAYNWAMMSGMVVLRGTLTLVSVNNVANYTKQLKSIMVFVIEQQADASQRASSVLLCTIDDAHCCALNRRNLLQWERDHPKPAGLTARRDTDVR